MELDTSAIISQMTPRRVPHGVSCQSADECSEDHPFNVSDPQARLSAHAICVTTLPVLSGNHTLPHSRAPFPWTVQVNSTYHVTVWIDSFHVHPVARSGLTLILLYMNILYKTHHTASVQSPQCKVPSLHCTAFPALHTVFSAVLTWPTSTHSTSLQLIGARQHPVWAAFQSRVRPWPLGSPGPRHPRVGVQRSRASQVPRPAKKERKNQNDGVQRTARLRPGEA